ncbi:MAG: MFS transporter [Porphyromonadaceae bacterium CG2_30_38_12]|nr:MAG: MFS transporter [Porphyromonadaceae bacterium CG2_30_38_12]
MQSKQGHPKGLYLLFVTEMWERFSYYGMRALFMLYITKALLFDKGFAAQIYGSYTGLVYLTPLLGGYIADRYWGNRRSIFWGGIIMALGQFLMFASAINYQDIETAKYLMFLGLGGLILGNGLFKPNISTMVGHLYEPNDSRKDAAFTIFYMGINLGAALAPLWCGFVGDTGNPADFKWGFLSAGTGMLLSVTVFQILKNKYLCTPEGQQIGLSPSSYKQAATQVTEKHNEKSVVLELQNSKSRIYFSLAGFIALFLIFSINFDAFTNASISLFSGADWIGSAIFAVSLVMPIFIIVDKSLTKVERSRIFVIYIISFFVIFFWAAFEQAGASLTFFADEQTDRNIFGWVMPASAFQSFNAIFVVSLAPLFAMLWTALGKRGMEPSSPAKQSIGLFLLAVGYLVIAIGVRGVDANTKVSMLWLTSLYLLHTMGELCLSPIGLSIVNKLSPLRFSSLLMGVWFMSNAAANKFAGILSGLYPENGISKSFAGYEITTLYDFFIFFVIMSGIASVVLFVLSKWLEKLMGGIR